MVSSFPSHETSVSTKENLYVFVFFAQLGSGGDAWRSWAGLTLGYGFCKPKSIHARWRRAFRSLRPVSEENRPEISTSAIPACLSSSNVVVSPPIG